MGRLIIGKERLHPVLHHEASQHPFVIFLAGSVCEPCPQLSKNNEGKDDDLGLSEDGLGFTDTVTKIDISVRVESNSHFQRSSSI